MLVYRWNAKKGVRQNLIPEKLFSWQGENIYPYHNCRMHVRIHRRLNNFLGFVLPGRKIQCYHALLEIHTDNYKSRNCPAQPMLLQDKYWSGYFYYKIE